MELLEHEKEDLRNLKMYFTHQTLAMYYYSLAKCLGRRRARFDTYSSIVNVLR